MTVDATPSPTLTAGDFDYVREVVRRRSAIVLDPGKEYLVEARLGTLARQLGFATVGELVARLRTGATRGLAERVTEAMTTNETSFFRDVAPFDALRSVVVPGLIERRRGVRRLRIWCAAASSGQEPYTIAMLLHDGFPELTSWDLEILGTDISEEMLVKARSGRFNAIEVNRGLPASMLVRHFDKRGVEYELKPQIRSMVEFRAMNLAAPWPPLGEFDIVFLRNVLIYFDVETKREILGRTRRLLRPDGYLFLGAAETTVNLDDGFERAPYERAGCYALRGRRHDFGG